MPLISTQPVALSHYLRTKGHTDGHIFLQDIHIAAPQLWGGGSRNSIWEPFSSVQNPAFIRQSSWKMETAFYCIFNEWYCLIIVRGEIWHERFFVIKVIFVRTRLGLIINAVFRLYPFLCRWIFKFLIQIFCK